jgi:hypothetical protein
MNRVLWGWKDIAAGLGELLGRAVSERTAQDFERHGLPVRRFMRAVRVDATELAEWVNRNMSDAKPHAGPCSAPRQSAAGRGSPRQAARRRE